MLKENISTFKKDLVDTYNILNSIEIKTEHFNAKKYSVAMDLLLDIFNRIDKIFVNTETTLEQTETGELN